MDLSFPRPTTAFICHPNAHTIAREIDLAMARCGLLPAEGDGAEAVPGSHRVQLTAGVGMWHVLRVTPGDGLWRLVDEAGTPLLQLLCGQLSVPGFATVFGQEGAASEVFIELDVQGQLRAAGEWQGHALLGGIRLSQPVQPFSSGLRGLWSQGQTEAAFHGLNLTPVAAFLRIALQRLGGEQAASQEGPGTEVFSGGYMPAQEPALSEFIAQRAAERMQRDSETEVESEAPEADAADALPDAHGPEDEPAAAKEVEEQVPEAAVAPSQAEPEAAQRDDTAGETAATGPQPEGPRYAGGERIAPGDAVAIDGGMIGGRVQAVHADAASPDGFRVLLDMADRPREMAGADFVARAVRAGTGATSCQDAEDRVIEALRARAAHGDAQAMLFLGIRLLRGAGIGKDPRRAYEWLVQAADQGDALAQHLVGVMSRNPARSARYWQRAAEQGHAAAQFCLGLAHVRGLGVPPDAEQGRAWLARAARQGHLAALYDLAVLDAGASQALVDDPDARLPLFLAKAEAGDAVASWLLGQVVQNGQAGADLDVNRVVECLGDAVAQGFEPAHEPLAALAARADVDEIVRERVRRRLGERAAAELAGPPAAAQGEPLPPEPEQLEEPEEPEAPSMAHPSIEVQSEALGAALQFAAVQEAGPQAATAPPEDGADGFSEEDRAFLGVFRGLTSFEDLKPIAEGEGDHAQTEPAALAPLAEDEPPGGSPDDAPATATPETAGSRSDDVPGPSPARKPWWKLW